MGVFNPQDDRAEQNRGTAYILIVNEKRGNYIFDRITSSASVSILLKLNLRLNLMHAMHCFTHHHTDFHNFSISWLISYPTASWELYQKSELSNLMLIHNFLQPLP